MEAKSKKKKDSETDIIDNLNNKVKELENKLLYKDAELINYRKRKDEEVINTLKYASTDLVLELLVVVDDLERAIKLDDDILDDSLSKFLEGFKMVYSRLINVLTAAGVKEIEALGVTFNPNLHEAMLTDNIKTKENNIIIDVMQKGYMYKDKVIRPAMVKVNINDEKGDDKNE